MSGAVVRMPRPTLGLYPNPQVAGQSLRSGSGGWTALDRGGESAGDGSWQIFRAVERAFPPTPSIAIRHRRAALSAVRGSALRASAGRPVERGRHARAGVADARPGSGIESVEGADQSALLI